MPPLAAALALLAAAAPPVPDVVPPEVRRVAEPLADSGARVAILARAIGSHGTIVRLDADRPLVPASTAKLVTTACALEALGPSHRFRTEFLAGSAPRPDGVFAGPLYVRGTGDPQLKAEDLWAAVRQLAAGGLTRVEGGLVGDDTALEGPGRPASWPRSDASTRAFHAAQGALSLAWNATEIVVRPGGRAGRPAAVTAFPVASPVRLVSRVTTGGATNVRLTIDDGAGAGPARVTVSGTIRAGAAPWRRWVRLGHPTRAVLDALRSLLAEAGIEVEGETRTGEVPEGATLLHAHEGRRLAELAADVNKFSSNFGAELLLRSLGRASGQPGTTSGGLAAVEACLARLGVGRSGLRLVDGSGYGRDNRATARGLVELLEAAAEAPGFGAEFVASLARAGEDGSLAERLAGHEGRVRAKTGTLSGVAALAGYATPREGPPVAFAILVNGPARVVGPSAADDLLRAVLDAAARAEPRGAPSPAAAGTGP